MLFFISHYFCTRTYPGDKAQSTGAVSQWGASGSILQENSSLAFYEIDTYGGQSGSAMLKSLNQIIDVHNGGYDLSGNSVIDSNGGPKWLSLCMTLLHRRVN
ncbi:hypothetical protein CON73_15790 [Bacillus toyonensis]|uniref:Serine protease n=1 Tax=Bacillus toyonensis TaxID=155322 RepID=A0A2B5AKZ7_9BACI|nr:hypothetical protein CN688_25300 [Bacillus toyonensis]PEK90788.1 hypothetical protein CN594_01740 [Bacillus toyonensis]PEL14482.1 hypothetical protein CN624_32765 [Bacillus toyonensis]PFY28472.1 hypothetical protein COL55_34865 [Bacillus toyonensis]PFY32663.1 hypothetical protein COL54_31630 [Bacillus toyonensis]